MNTDPIADLLTRIRNASNAKKESLTIPYSNFKNEVLNLLKKRGYVNEIKIVKGEKFRELEITLPKTSEPLHLKRISKPGQRIYVQKNNVPRVLEGLGMSIISTSKGLMDDSEARKAGVGGELICEIY